MELLDGETLEQLSMTRGGTIPADELARYAAQVLDTLVAAHARGIVHRDIKPENLFVTDDGIVKILDFGIARMDGLGDALRVTRAGEPIGTPAFMSPEQARGRLDDVDERTDVYSLGATMFTMLTGEPVHAEPTTVAELIAAVITRPARRVRQAGDVPAALAAFVDRALAFDKSERFATAEEMRSALDVVYLEITGEAIPATPAPTVTLPPPVVRPRFVRGPIARRAAVLLLPTAIAAAGIALVSVTAKSAPPRPELAIVEGAPPALPAPSAPVSVAAADPVPLPVPAALDTASPPRVASEVERRPSPEPAQPAEARASTSSTPVSWLSRRNPLYSRRY